MLSCLVLYKTCTGKEDVWKYASMNLENEGQGFWKLREGGGGGYFKFMKYS